MDGNAAPTAGPSNSSPPQLSPPISLAALSQRTSSRNAIYDSFNNAPSSPPTTPPRNRRKGKTTREKRKQPLRPYASAENGIDKRHSHGLSWSSTTRDSVVDNLLFSLDNLSRKDVSGDDNITDLEFDRSTYRFPDIPPPLPPIHNRTARRARRHTQSSSLSIDYEPLTMPESPPLPRASASTKGRRSITSSNNTTHITVNGRKRTSKISVGSIGSTETQKPAINDVPATKSSVIAEKSETSRTDDLYSSMVDKSKDGRKRRSMSMDQIFADSVLSPNSILDRGRPVPSVYSTYDAGYIGYDVAPEPTIAGGPRRRDNPTATGPVYVNQAPQRSTLRKITTQTDLRSANAQGPLNPPIPQDVRSQASNFVRMSGIQSRPGTQAQSKAQPGPTMQAPSANNAPPAPPVQKPGFFRRMFGGGSSRATSTQPVQSHTPDFGDATTVTLTARTSTSNVAQARTGTRSSSKERDTSYPPISLNKKSSSLFRRRKKSVQEPPPLPPPPIPAAFKVAAAEPSPVGDSLRKALDPYLDGDEKVAPGLPSEQQLDIPRPLTQESSTEDSDNPDIFHSGYTQRPDASLGSRDLASRSSSTKPKQSLENEASVKTKMKVKKRNPAVLSPTNTSFYFDSSSREHSGTRTAEPEKVSPITDHPPDDNAICRPVSHASNAETIIAIATSTLEPNHGGRKSSVVSTVSSEKANDSHIRPSTQDRPNSKKSEHLVLKRSVEEILLDNSEFSTVPESQYSTTSPPFYVATNAALSSGVHSPISPSSQYHSATSLPLQGVQADDNEPDVSSTLVDEGAEYRERARKIFEGDEEDVTKAEAAAWLGEKNTLSTRTLDAYLQLFDFTGINILAALRLLCGKVVLRGETQQFDRIITALSARWCACNVNHGFKAQDVVHTICYSLILLNTDLHLADIGEKMSRSAYVKNTLPTIRRVVADAAPNAFEDNTVKPVPFPPRPTLPWSQSNGSVPQTPVTPNSPTNERASLDQERSNVSKPLSMHPPIFRQDSDGMESFAGAGSNALVTQPWTGTMRAWEMEIENILKSFFVATKVDRLPLHGAPISEPPAAERSAFVANLNGLNRTNSVVSKTASDTTSFRAKPSLKSMTLGFQNKYNRSRPKLYPASTLNSSKTSFDDGSSVWSPTHSTFSKYSLSKTLTSASMQSFGQHFSPNAEFKHSIGFANALSQAIIREENAAMDNESGSISVPGGLLDDEALTLEGAPWAKEGLVKHKHHLETPGKRAKERGWVDCFAVISKGKLTLFAFNTSTKAASMGRKALTKYNAGGRAASVGAPRVGGGDWMENAEQLNVFLLRQTIASTLPSPGYSKTRPHVWALSLPSGAVHLFQVGTPEIAHEFMSTANYWCARLSKEPLSGGVSNVEYGWSDTVINPAFIERPFSPPVNAPPVSLQNRQIGHKYSTSAGSVSRPSITSSLRTSLDTGFGPRPRLPGDKMHLADWQPPTQSMMASQLMEVDQLKALTAYVSHVEAELAKHNELKGAIELAVSVKLLY